MGARRLVVFLACTALAIAMVAPSAGAAPPPPGTWRITASMHVGRILPTATVLNDGRVLVAGGEDEHNNPIASAELYSPATRTWSMTGSMTTARVFHTATLLPDGKVLVTGGRIDQSTDTNTAELYDPTTGTWSAAQSMNVIRAVHTATLLANGKVLVAGGQDTSPLITPSAEIYDPSADTWTPTGSMNVGRYQHTATLLTNGRVLVAGGLDNSFNPTNSAEIFNPADGTWTTTAPMDTARYVHAAVRTLLPDGKVLVCGGGDSTSPFDATPTAELFDPSGTWSPTTTFMTQPRYFHTATLLPDGRVLVAGGAGGAAQHYAVTATAEIFDPTTGIWKKTGSLVTLRAMHAAALIKLPAGTRHRYRVLVVGGWYGGPALRNAELYTIPAA